MSSTSNNRVGNGAAGQAEHESDARVAGHYSRTSSNEASSHNPRVNNDGVPGSSSHRPRENREHQLKSTHKRSKEGKRRSQPRSKHHRRSHRRDERQTSRHSRRRRRDDSHSSGRRRKSHSESSSSSDNSESSSSDSDSSHESATSRTRTTPEPNVVPLAACGPQGPVLEGVALTKMPLKGTTPDPNVVPLAAFVSQNTIFHNETHPGQASVALQEFPFSNCAILRAEGSEVRRSIRTRRPSVRLLPPADLTTHSTPRIP